jgi:hypothetical protein
MFISASRIAPTVADLYNTKPPQLGYMHNRPQLSYMHNRFSITQLQIVHWLGAYTSNVSGAHDRTTRQICERVAEAIMPHFLRPY